MALVLPATISDPTTGQPILAAWGDGVNDSTAFLATNKPHCEAYKTTVQSIPNNTNTALLFPTETFDVGGIHSTGSNTDRFTIPSGEGAKYDIACGGAFAANGTGARALEIQKNGASLTPPRSAIPAVIGASPFTVTLTAFAVPLAAGDIIRMIVFQNSGGALDFDDYWLTIKWYST